MSELDESSPDEFQPADEADLGDNREIDSESDRDPGSELDDQDDEGLRKLTLALGAGSVLVVADEPEHVGIE